MTDERLPAILPVNFWIDYEPNPDEPGEQIAVEWVAWVKKGDASGAMTQAKISRLAPRENRAGATVQAVEWPAVEPAYEAWKRSEEPPETGTPLAAWPGCTRPLITALKKINVKTVEDFATAPEHAFQGLPVPNIRFLREQAGAFLTARGDQSEGAAEIAEKDTRIEAQAAEIEGLRAEIAALTAGKPAARAKKAAAG